MAALVSEFKRLQKAALLYISGALRITPTEAMNVLLDLLPITCT